MGSRLFLLINVFLFVAAADANAFTLPFFCQKQLTGVDVGVFTPIPKKVLVIESMIGNGHKTATDTVLTNLHELNPNLDVSRFGIESLKPKWQAFLELEFFWTVINRAAWLYDKLFRREM